MEKLITVGVELTEDIDRDLRIEAAKRGLSKRKLAAQIIVEWLEQNHVKSLREILDDIMVGIAANTADNEEKDRLFNTLSAFIDGCTKLVSLTIMESSTGIKQDMEVVRGNIRTNLEVINKFCKEHGISCLPEREIEDLAFDIVEEFKP